MLPELPRERLAGIKNLYQWWADLLAYGIGMGGTHKPDKAYRGIQRIGQELLLSEEFVGSGIPYSGRIGQVSRTKRKIVR